MPALELSLAVVAPSQGAARRAISLLERAGLVVTTELVITGQLEFDRLARSPDMVLIDRGSAASGAVEAVTRARRELPGARIVVIFDDAENDPHRILSAGADGLVSRAEAAATLPEAMRAVAAGQLSVPARLRELIEPPALSRREKQVLGLMADGLTNAQIGRRLYLSESTVKTHLSNAFKRLGVRSRREASARLLAGDPAFREDLLMALERARSEASRPWASKGGSDRRVPDKSGDSGDTE